MKPPRSPVSISSSMATRALVAGRRVAGQSVLPALASSRGGGAQSNPCRRSAHTRTEERNAGHDAAARVEAALNSKDVEEVAQGRAATVLPGDVVRDAGAAWVPDQDTGVFVPAEEAASGIGARGASVLDQTVFNREEEMEDVERPAVDMGNGDAGAR